MCDAAAAVLYDTRFAVEKSDGHSVLLFLFHPCDSAFVEAATIDASTELEHCLTVTGYDIANRSLYGALGGVYAAF